MKVYPYYKKNSRLSGKFLGLTFWLKGMAASVFGHANGFVSGAGTYFNAISKALLVLIVHTFFNNTLPYFGHLLTSLSLIIVSR